VLRADSPTLKRGGGMRAEEDVMNPKKQKVKDRRRARKLADQAWEAVDAGNLDLAEKIVRRAVAAQTDNPVLWNDQGRILAMRRKEAEAADSFAAALSLAPTFAEPYAHLAALRIRHGFAQEALALQAQAVRYAPENAAYAEQLEAYRALAGQRSSSAAAPSAKPTPMTDAVDAKYAHRLAELNWEVLGARLTREGCVCISGLLDRAPCEGLCAMFDDDARFAKTVVMDRPDFGKGVYRYFKAPIPDLVDHLRRTVYPFVARIANDWQRLLGEPEDYPPDWEAFRELCRSAGQTSPTPILLKYGPGGFNALHRDLRGSVFLPIQMAVILSPRMDPSDDQGTGFLGGDFLLCDVPESKRSMRREVAAGLGDALLFCTRDRLVSVGGAYGLQPVKHGVAPITTGVRYVLGVPFHEYRP
jgi:hypothetical protein